MLTKTNELLKSFTDRWTRLEEERLDIVGAQKECMDDAAAAGFKPSALKRAAKVHALEQAKRKKFDDEQGDFELYLAQLEGKEMPE